MSFGFLDEVTRIHGIQRRDLVEKELFLHRLIRYLSLYPAFRARQFVT